MRISAAMVWYAAPAAVGPAEAFTLCISLKAAQKLLAAPTETFVNGGDFVEDFELAALGAVEPAALGAVELAPLGNVELAPVGDVDFVELATLLEPEEHPASPTTSTNKEESSHRHYTQSVVGCVIAP